MNEGLMGLNDMRESNMDMTEFSFLGGLFFLIWSVSFKFKLSWTLPQFCWSVK